MTLVVPFREFLLIIKAFEDISDKEKRGVMIYFGSSLTWYRTFDLHLEIDGIRNC